MTDAESIRVLLLDWARNTQNDQRDLILANHHSDLTIFDVLPPMQYTSAAEYQASWDAWQPESVGSTVFELQNLKITAGSDVAFAYAFIRCGGTTPKGRKFEDTVRATFCLQKFDAEWLIMHQHVSKPLGAK